MKYICTACDIRCRIYTEQKLSTIETQNANCWIDRELLCDWEEVEEQS